MKQGSATLAPTTNSTRGLKEDESYPVHILIVDDDEPFGRMLVHVIRKMTKFACSFVQDARKALEVLDESVVDVVITDIKMPDMSGLELTKIIKTKYDSDVIIITGYYEDFSYEEAIDNGANDFIEKPLKPTELIIKLRRILRERAISYKHKQVEEALRVSYRFLTIANRHSEVKPLLEEFVVELKKFTGCAAIGTYILDGDGNIPYTAHEGFSKEFYELESPLSIKSDQCMCINVIKGTTDPKLPFYTKGGSFYMNGGATAFLATVSEEENGQTRNVCNKVSYETVALIPIRQGDTIQGLIHIADPQENMVPLEMVEVLEGVAMQLATAVQRLQTQEALWESERNFRLLSSQLISAQEDERRRISLELHDEMGQTLTAIKFNLIEMEKGLPLNCVPALREKFEETQSIIGHASEQVRELSLNLHPPMLDDLGLVPTVRWHLNGFSQKSYIEAKFEVVNLDVRLDQDVETALYRIVQEALNNVAKHAEAKKVLVRLHRKGDTVAVYIEDDGRGFDMKEIPVKKIPEKGIGILGMKQRAHMLGADLTIESRKGHGTRVSIEVPYCIERKYHG